MGAETWITIAGDKHDASHESPFLGRDFTHEIAHGFLWYKGSAFLSEQEAAILYPINSDDYNDGIEELIHPDDLISVLKKVKKYLKSDKDPLPIEIELDYDKMEKENLSTDIIINNSKCWIQGDSYYNKVSSMVRIVNYPMEPNEVDVWIDIKDKVEIEGRIYYLKKITRYEKYTNMIDDVIAFCEYAKQKHKMIDWKFYS